MEQIQPTRITISSHNINGFGHSKSFLYSLCEQFPDAIRGVQEHWLAPPFKKQSGVNRLRALHPDFDGFGNSAMKKEVESKVRMGRPYGGTGFLFPKKYAQNIKPLINYKHERVSVLQMMAEEAQILLISVYLPYYNTRDLQNYLLIYQDTLAYVEMVMTENPACGCILLLDMNCNLQDTSHPYSSLMREFMTRNLLVNAFDLDTNFDFSSSYTRCDPKTNSYTLIDGILLSVSLTKYASNIRISDYGDNVSDHRPVELDLSVSFSTVDLPKKRIMPFVPWHKLDAPTLSNFRQTMTNKLDEIVIPFDSILHGYHCCTNSYHVSAIQSYYENIVSAIDFADRSLPRAFPSHNQPFWSNDLNELKQRSIQCCRFWKVNGSPRFGEIYECKRKCSGQYKAAIRAAKSKSDTKLNDRLYNHLTAKNSNEFWKALRSKKRDSDALVTRVNGETSEKGIANSFRNHFMQVYSSNDGPAHESLKQTFLRKFGQYFHDHLNDSIGPFFLSWSDMLDIMASVKVGKSTASTIKPQHILHGSEKLVFHLQLLFNAMIQHGCIVSDFLKGTITPVVKDAEGDVSDPSNYRPITLGTLLSKLFEKAIDLKISPFLATDHLQFGFKRRTSSSHALFVLRNTVNHFTERGSNVFVSFLDCSKAFDKISHYGLFLKLIDRCVPLCLLTLIVVWHLNMTCKVKWGDALSEEFDIPSGTKQGGIISPNLFSLYINDVVTTLRKQGLSCHFLKQFIACILFADDMALLAPSRMALQKMIDICSEHCREFCLSFNSKKSKVIVFGRSSKDPLKPLTLNGSIIDFVDEWKYLGTTIKSGSSLGFSARPDLASFYRATNAIIHSLPGAHEHTLITLLYTNCVPILSYACAVKEYSASEMTSCNTAMNNALRKVFGFSRWESIRTLREVFGMKSLYDIFKTTQDRFNKNCRSHPNPIVSYIASQSQLSS